MQLITARNPARNTKRTIARGEHVPKPMILDRRASRFGAPRKEELFVCAMFGRFGVPQEGDTNI